MGDVKIGSVECEICEEIHRQGLNSKPPKISKAGKVVLGVGATIAAIVYGVALPFVLPGFRKVCLPYVPATEAQIQNVIKCLANRKGSLIDLGSGDGRIVQAVMKDNLHKNHNNMAVTKAEGVELNTWLVLFSKWSAWRNGFKTSQVSFYKKDIFKTDLSKYNNIVVFGVESLMEALEHKLQHELTDDAILIACRFPMPNWPSKLVVGEGIDTVWLYDRSCVSTNGTPV